MCCESLSLLHTLFRKLGLQSITFFFSPAAGVFVPGRKMHGEHHGEHLQVPAHHPGSAQPLFVGSSRTICSSHGASRIKVGRICVLESALFSWGSRHGVEPRHSNIWVMHNSFYNESSHKLCLFVCSPESKVSTFSEDQTPVSIPGWSPENAALRIPSPSENRGPVLRPIYVIGPDPADISPSTSPVFPQ